MAKYGETIKKLVAISGVKLSVIAREVGYDLSYVSKWCNKDKLPAIKVAPEINYTIGKLVATELSRINSEDLFYEAFQNDPLWAAHASASQGQASPTRASQGQASSARASQRNASNAKAALQKDITRLLNLSFDESKRESDKKHTSQFATGETIIRTSEIADFFSRRLPEMILEADSALGEDEKFEVLCTLDICKFLGSAVSESPVSARPNHDIHVRMGLNLERFLEDPSSNLKNLYFFLSAKEHISFDFYEDALMMNLNTIVIKDHLALLCALDQHGHIITVSVISNPEDVNQIYERILPAFRTTDLLIHHAEPDKMSNYGYRTGFYALSGYQIFQPFGFEFLLPEDCWPNISKAAKKLDPHGNLSKSTDQLRITWQETFEKGIIDFYLTKSALMKYMEDGEIVFADVPYRMSPEERTAHVKNALEMAINNLGIKFYVLNDDDLPSVQHLLKIGIYSNGKKMFLKCPGRYRQMTGPWFYSVVSDKLIQATTELLRELSAAPFCYEYDGAGLENFMEKYGSMVYRIIELG